MRAAVRLAIAATAILLSLAAGAAASPVTIGSPQEAEFHRAEAKVPGTFFNQALGEPGAQVSSPVDGAIVRLSILGAEGGPYRVSVLRPVGGNVFEGVARTEPLYFGEARSTFDALPVEQGDMIGLELQPGLKFGVAEAAGSATGVFLPPLAPATTGFFSYPTADHEFGFTATVLPTPDVTAVHRPSAYFRKPTRVTIRGDNFDEVQAVRFGAVPARRFRVVSERRIMAFTPQLRHLASTHVTVTTAAGRSEAGDGSRFAFTACVVPKLAGRTVASARRALRGRECRLGGVEKRAGATAHSGRVVAQRPAAGRKLPPGTRVRVTLG